MDTTTIQRFNHDKWELVKVSQLLPGDEIYSKDKGIVVVNSSPFKVDGEIMIPSIRKKPSIIEVFLDEGQKYPAICAVENYTCIGRVSYLDGTIQFRDDEIAPGCVYSPRLSKAELEIFCAKFIQRYADWYEVNSIAVDCGEPPAIESWWE